MLEAFIPESSLTQVDEAYVAVPPEEALQAAWRLDTHRSPLVRVLFGIRTLPERIAGHGPDPLPRDLESLAASTEPGFRLLAEIPRVGFAFGAIGTFWSQHVEFADVRPADFAAFDRPGWAKVAWSLIFQPWGDGGTRIALELRVSATDEASWRAVRRHFRLVRPFSRLVCKRGLALLVKDLGRAQRADIPPIAA